MALAALDRLLTSGNRRNATLDNRCCPMCDNFLYLFKGTPSARQQYGPWLGSGRGRKVPGAAIGRRGSRRRRLRSRGVSSPVGGGSIPLPLRLGTHGAGRRRSAVSPRPPPGGPHRHAPCDRALARVPGPSSSRRASCRRARSQSRALPTGGSFGWRYAPLLSVIFHGKFRAYDEDGAGGDLSGSAEKAGLLLSKVKAPCQSNLLHHIQYLGRLGYSAEYTFSSCLAYVLAWRRK